MGLSLIIIVSSCNSKDEDAVADSYVSTESVAITGFSLSADIRVMKNLDSVYFSIDLEHGVVFNADSLPKGTNITKLIPKITYPSSVTSAVIEMTGGTHREGTVNYYSNSMDTIDFTGDVTLTLGASGKTIEKTYRLKVNVHQTDPDTMYWDGIANLSLPSRLADPLNQKTTIHEGVVYSIIEEKDGTYTMSTTPDIFIGQWEKKAVDLGFVPLIEGFTIAPDGTFYMTDAENGNLMSSTDGLEWQAIDSGWKAIIGMYGDILTGISLQSEPKLMKFWPSQALPEVILPEGFPASGFSVPIEFTNRWTPDPTIVIFGGYPFNSQNTSASWAFDGEQWVDIAEAALPALSGMAVVPYYSYLNSASNGLLKEFEVYLAFGGYGPDGEVNRTVYVSYDHGINWALAQPYMQLPSAITVGAGADALTLGTSMQSNLSNRWKTTAAKRRLPFEIDGDLVKWDCPYLFIFGGRETLSDIHVIPAIRSGVLQRLTYEPLF